MKPYCCPNCKTNRSRFNLIEQNASSVKIDPKSGEVLNVFNEENIDAFHMQYKGPSYKVQCASCGLIEDEHTFIKFAEHNKKQ
ncbi:DNA alkylation repair protein [Thalassobacillus hwangdonensis]